MLPGLVYASKTPSLSPLETVYITKCGSSNCSTILSAQYAVQIASIIDTSAIMLLAVLCVENSSINTL